MSARNSVCAGIVTYNIGPRIHQCLNSAIDQVEQVVIVDNGSDIETTNELRNLESQYSLKVVYNKENLGIGKAMNQGVEYAAKTGCRWFLYLDHDSEATRGMVDKLLAVHLLSDGKAGVVAPLCYDRNACAFLVKHNTRMRAISVVEVRSVISSGSLINMQTFAKVGRFNEALFMYFVDDDFCMRARKGGFNVYMCRDAILVHSEGARVARRFLWKKITYEGYGNMARYYIARNAIYMLKTYCRNFSYCIFIIRRLATDVIKVMLYDDRRWQKMRAMVKGLADGLGKQLQGNIR